VDNLYLQALQLWQAPAARETHARLEYVSHTRMSHVGIEYVSHVRIEYVSHVCEPRICESLMHACLIYVSQHEFAPRMCE